MNRFEITASAPDKKAFSLIHYTKGDGIPAKQGIALWACDDCKTEVVGNHAVMFSCPCCTGNMKAGKTAEMTAAELNNAHHVADCTFCGSTMVSASTATAQFKDKNLYCPVCSETVAVADDAAMPDMQSDKDAGKTDDTADLGDETEDDSGDLPEGEDESTDDEDNSDDAADDEEETDDETTDDEENDETDNEDDGSDDEDNTDDKKTPTASNDKSGSGDGSGDDDGGDDSNGSDDTSSEDDETDEGDDTDSADDKKDSKDDTVAVGEGKDNTLDASLLAAMSGKDTDVNIVQSPDRNRWYLFADNAPVAISEAGRCQENLRSVFSTNQFATAFVAATEEGVTQDVLEEFGFEPVMTKVPVDEAVRQSVEAQVKEKAAAHSMTAAAYGDRFQQCFGMAAAGMPKRFFKGDKNPVEKALVSSLQKVGVRDASSIVANAFENHGKALYKALVLRANELMDKDDKTLEEIARLIDEREDNSLPDENPKTPPVAALASMEAEAVKPPVAVLASDSNDDDVFATFFQRRR